MSTTVEVFAYLVVSGLFGGFLVPKNPSKDGMSGAVMGGLMWPLTLPLFVVLIIPDLCQAWKLRRSRGRK